MDDAFGTIQLQLPFIANHMWAGVLKNLGQTHNKRGFLITVNEAAVFSSNAVYRVKWAFSESCN